MLAYKITIKNFYENFFIQKRKRFLHCDVLSNDIGKISVLELSGQCVAILFVDLNTDDAKNIRKTCL